MNIIKSSIHRIPDLLAIHEYVYFINIKLFKNHNNFNIEVNGDHGDR